MRRIRRENLADSRATTGLPSEAAAVCCASRKSRGQSPNRTVSHKQNQKDDKRSGKRASERRNSRYNSQLTQFGPQSGAAGFYRHCIRQSIRRQYRCLATLCCPEASIDIIPLLILYNEIGSGQYRFLSIVFSQDASIDIICLLKRCYISSRQQRVSKQ